MTIFIFLDTNVFLQCKTFTEIKWRDLFEISKEKDDIVIKVPYIVNKELDKAKKYEKKARNIQSKLRKLNNMEFDEGISLKISIFPTKWSSLKSEWTDKLDENESDCRIIAEILFFKENHPDDEIYFITGDNTPYFQANAMQIKTIFWLDNQYNEIFEQINDKTVKRNKLTDLKILFKNRKIEYQLSARKVVNFEEFIVEEFPDFPDLMNEKKNEINSTEINQISKKESVMTLKEAKEKGLIENGFIKSLEKMYDNFLPLNSFLNFKSDDQFGEEILEYYEEMKEYWKYAEIELYIINEGFKPYNNVNIEIWTVLEKGFELKSKEKLEKPEKPKFERNDFLINSYVPSLPIQYKEYNVKYSSPQKIEKEKKDIWVFGYSIKKIQHTETLSLYPLMIKFPENFKMKKIHFICKFKHDEEGITKDQKLILDVSKMA
ncbi:MAG: PIN domain-containing protein [Candidatus Lokiarchaeota archaeon]